MDQIWPWAIGGVAALWALFSSNQKQKASSSPSPFRRGAAINTFAVNVDAAQRANATNQLALRPLTSNWNSNHWIETMPLPDRDHVSAWLHSSSFNQRMPTAEEIAAVALEAKAKGYPDGVYARQLPTTCKVTLKDGRVGYTDCGGLTSASMGPQVDETGMVM